MKIPRFQSIELICDDEPEPFKAPELKFADELWAELRYQGSAVPGMPRQAFRSDTPSLIEWPQATRTIGSVDEVAVYEGEAEATPVAIHRFDGVMLEAGNQVTVELDYSDIAGIQEKQ